MGRNGCVPGRARKILPVLVGDVLAFAVAETLGQAEVNNEDGVLGRFRATDQEIIRFNVPVDDALFMDFLDPLDHLDRDEQAGLQVERPLACLEEILERGAQHVHDHDVEGLIRDGIVSADVVKRGHAGFAPQFVDQLAFPEKHHVLLMLGSLLQLGCKHLTRLFLFDFENLAESAASKFLYDFEAAVENFLAFFQV